MNIIFFGSSQFAVPSLKALLTTVHKVSCVVTQPDRKKGRGLHFEGTAIKAAAEESGLEIYQPYKINTGDAIKFLKDLKPDLFIVISYGQILSQEVLAIPKIFCINIHASLLPKCRGAAPINWAIVNGEKDTGITIIKMTEEMDAGPIILQKIININDSDTVVTLQDKLSKVAAELLIDSFRAIENNDYKLTPQDEKKVTFAPKLKKEDGLIYWNKPAYDICNLIRGVYAWPGAFTYYKGKSLKIFTARVGLAHGVSGYPGIRVSGEVLNVSKQGITVATGKDNLIIEELQVEGKRRMLVEEFIAGHRIQAGEILGRK